MASPRTKPALNTQVLGAIVEALIEHLSQSQKLLESAGIVSGKDFASAKLTQSSTVSFLIFLRIDAKKNFQLEVFCAHRHTKERDYKTMVYLKYGSWPSDPNAPSQAAEKIARAIEGDLLKTMTAA